MFKTVNIHNNQLVEATVSSKIHKHQNQMEVKCQIQ